jgi:hypothetical protein
MHTKSCVKFTQTLFEASHTGLVWKLKNSTSVLHRITLLSVMSSLFFFFFFNNITCFIQVKVWSHKYDNLNIFDKSLEI